MGSKYVIVRNDYSYVSK